MRYNLARMVKPGTRRKLIRFRPIVAPAVRASDLFAIFSPVLTAWQAALAGIEAEYARTLATMTTDAPSDLAVRIGQVEAEGAAILLTVRARLARWAERLESWHRARWRANVLAATKVDLGTFIGPGDVRETLETVIERNVGLIRAVSDDTRKRVGDAVFRGLQNRTPARELAKELREAVALERRRALRIASDQTSTLASQLNSERRRAAGIDSWEWIASGKRHPREHHKARDGNLYSENSARVGQEYEGKRIKSPPPSNDLPGVPIWCGCVERSVLILD